MTISTSVKKKEEYIQPITNDHVGHFTIDRVLYLVTYPQRCFFKKTFGKVIQAS